MVATPIRRWSAVTRALYVKSIQCFEKCGSLKVQDPLSRLGPGEEKVQNHRFGRSNRCHISAEVVQPHPFNIAHSYTSKGFHTNNAMRNGFP